MADALFSLYSEAGKIKRSKNGSYKLILKNLAAEQDWFTNRPQRLTGAISPEEIVQGWSSYFKDSSPNSIISFADSEGNFKRIAFEQFQPKLNRKGNKMVSKINPLVDETQDFVTGLKLKSGSSLMMNNPSVVVDDFVISTIQIDNNMKVPLKLVYTVGDIDPTASWEEATVAPGSSVTRGGTIHDKWDISMEVQIYDKYKWQTGITVQADNPWYGHPQFEYNQRGDYFTSDDAPFSIPNSAWGLDSPAASFQLTNDSSNDKAWTLAINSTD